MNLSNYKICVGEGGNIINSSRLQVVQEEPLQSLWLLCGVSGLRLDSGPTQSHLHPIQWPWGEGRGQRNLKFLVKVSKDQTIDPKTHINDILEYALINSFIVFLWICHKIYHFFQVWWQVRFLCGTETKIKCFIYGRTQSLYCLKQIKRISIFAQITALCTRFSKIIKKKCSNISS